MGKPLNAVLSAVWLWSPLALPSHLETNWSPSTQASEEIELAKGCSMESILLSSSYKMREKTHSISALKVLSAKEDLE